MYPAITVMMYNQFLFMAAANGKLPFLSEIQKVDIRVIIRSYGMAPPVENCIKINSQKG